MSVEFQDFSIQVKGKISDRVNAALEECAGELESQTKRNSRVATGRTKNSFRHVVDDETHTAYIGSDLENAIWEEFGTGEHALNGDGRKGGWRYQDEKGQWHFTRGKTPTRAFWRAYTSLKTAIVRRLEIAMRGL